MTGEITLTRPGAADRRHPREVARRPAGRAQAVILPRENETDLGELPPETRDAIEFIPADTIEDVFAAAFAGSTPGPAPRRGLGAVDRQAARDFERRLTTRARRW